MSPLNSDDLKRAATVAAGFMELGRQAIDRKYGEGHAAENPMLLAAFMLSAALSFSISKHTEESNHEQP